MVNNLKNLHRASSGNGSITLSNERLAFLQDFFGRGDVNVNDQ